MALPLEGLKVLDLSRLLPGPYATLVLADLGAHVDKLEDPQGGDYLRQMPPLDGDTSALFEGLNRNKRSIALDLKDPHGRAAFLALLPKYDVLVESFRPGVMERLGLGWDALSQVNPRLVMCSISGFGQTGPDRLKAGHDLGYIARAGVLGYGGADGGPPALPGAQLADIGAGSLFAVVGVLAAIVERQTTGQGRFVDVSMTDGATAFIHMHLASRLLLGAEGKPLARGRETLNGGSPCYGVYRTKDSRWLAVGALEPKFFHGVLETLGLPEDLAVGGWDSGPDGQKTRAALERTFAQKTLAEWTAVFREKDLCVEPVLEGDEVLSDPQLISRGLFRVHDGRTWLKTPLHLGEVAVKPPPALGAHTREALAEAGVSAAAIDALAKPKG